MKRIKILSILILGILFISCEKDQSTDQSTKTTSPLGTYFTESVNADIIQNTDNQLYIYSTYYNNKFSNGGEANFQVRQSGMSKTVKIDNKQLDFGKNDVLSFNENQNPNLIPVVNPGDKNVTFTLEGQTKTGTIYNSKPVIINSLNDNHPAAILISKSTGINLTWTPDSKNGNDKIAVALINRGDILNNSTNPPKNSSISIITDDDGSQTISSSQLSDNNFNLGDYVDIYIGRGNNVKINNTAVIYYNVNLVQGKIIK